MGPHIIVRCVGAPPPALCASGCARAPSTLACPELVDGPRSPAGGLFCALSALHRGPPALFTPDFERTSPRTSCAVHSGPQAHFSPRTSCAPHSGPPAPFTPDLMRPSPGPAAPFTPDLVCSSRRTSRVFAYALPRCVPASSRPWPDPGDGHGGRHHRRLRRSSSSRPRSAARCPASAASCCVWIVAGALTWFGALHLRRAGVGVSPRTGGVYVFLREDILAGRRIPLGLGDVLEHALRHHRRDRDGLRPLRGDLRPARDDLGIRLVAVARHPRAVGDQLRRRPPRQRSPDRAHHHRKSRRSRSCSSPAVLDRAGTPRCPSRARRRTIRAGFLRALVAGLFAFGGWHMVTYAAEETRDAAADDPARADARHRVVIVCYLG